MLDLPVEGGVANMQFFVLDTTDMLMRGSGKIDLGGKYDLLLAPGQACPGPGCQGGRSHAARGPGIRYDPAATGLGLLEMRDGRAPGPAGLFVGSDTFRKQRQKCAQSLDSVSRMK